MKEIWAYAPRDTKAHLYCDDDTTAIRRLCHRNRISVDVLKYAGTAERCRLCLNIRGLLGTQRRKGTKRKTA